MTKRTHDKPDRRRRAADAAHDEDLAERHARLGETQPDATRAQDPADDRVGAPSRLNENAGDVPEETRGTKGEQGRAFRGE